jgi:hypothetical protein
MPFTGDVHRLAERLATRLERQYRDDADLLLAGVVIRAKNPGGPASTHYLFDPTSRREVIELLDEIRRNLIEEEF